MTRTRDLIRAGLAGLILLATIAGAPLALWQIAATLDLHTPAGGWLDALTRPDDGNLLLLALLVIGWACWAAFTLATLTEVIATARGRPAPRLPGLAAPQRAAAALIAAAAVLAPTTGTTPAGAPASSSVTLPVAVTTAASTVAHLAVTTSPAITRATSAATETRHAEHADIQHDLPVIAVHRHDTLWHLAETHLGAGERWTEIYRLNRDRPQPDGRALHDPDWIYPGWQLRLPRDARNLPGHPPAAAEPRSSTPPQPASSHGTTRTDLHQERDRPQHGRHYTVRAGDTLWDITARQLGDPTRWRDLYRINKNQPQPDGQALTDPQLILPGWHLRIPDPHTPKHTEHERPTHHRADPSTKPATPPKATSAPAAAPTPSTTSASPAAPPSASAPVPGLVVPPAAGKEPLPAADGPTTAPHTPDPDGQTATPTVVAEDDDAPITESALLPLLGLGLGAATLTGLVAEIRRRRRRQQSSRRPGQRIPMPEPDAATRESTARMHTIPGTVEAITAALRAVAVGCRRDHRPLPDLLLIHASADGVRLQFTEPDHDAIPPFTATDDGTWLLTQDPTTLPTIDTDPYPALVCLGVADGAMLVLNLEAIGTLGLTGDEGRVQAALRAYAVDLAIGPFSGAATLTLAGAGFESLAATLDPGRSHPSRPGQATRELVNHSAALTGLLDGRGLRDARAARGLEDSTRPTLLISDEQLTEVAHPWSGAALIHSEPEGSGSWQLELPASGPAVLQPLDLHLDPQQLSTDDYQSIVDLLTIADIEPGHQHPEDEARETVQTRVREALPAPPTSVREPPISTADRPPPGDAPRVLLLGPVQVTGVRDERAPHRTRRLTELVVYLALHPDATAAQIDEALWPGQRVVPATRSSLVSRTRQWLGYDSERNPYLPLVSEGGRLTLAKSVTCDWYDFLRHARAGLQGDDPGELTAALDLVRGRPFQGIDDHRYTWAEADIQQMISTIVDVAQTLATIHVHAGDHREAMHAALTGIEVDESSDHLLQVAASSASRCGDVTQVRRLQRLLDDRDWTV